jgi:hypothetical protein
MESIKVEIQNSNKSIKDELHIGKNGIKLVLFVYHFIDKDTKQYVAYSPTLDISGYGSTEERAQEMMKFSIKDFAIYLNNLSTRDREKELFSLGWKKDKFKNKDFSKVYVDSNGDLKDFNAEEGSIKKHELLLA